MDPSKATEAEQQALCKRFHVEFKPPRPDSILAVSDTVHGGFLPLNGLRHPPEGIATGWFVWGGEVLSQADDFFHTHHVSDLNEVCPLVLKYLALPPGWRFLATPEDEDVWFDDLSVRTIDPSPNESEPPSRARLLRRSLEQANVIIEERSVLPPPPEVFSGSLHAGDYVKIAFPASGGKWELMWVKVESVSERSLRGIVMNESVLETTVSHGDRVEFYKSRVLEHLEGRSVAGRGLPSGPR